MGYKKGDDRHLFCSPLELARLFFGRAYTVGMKLIYGGVRGSFAVPEAGFLRYGGETTSVLVEGAGGERVIIDLGTGARGLGRRLAAAPQRRLLALTTHYHLDHVMGLPSLPQVYDKDWTLEFAAPLREGRAVGDVLARILDEPFWPLQWHDMKSRLQTVTFADDGLAAAYDYGGLKIRWTSVHHDGGCTAYRIDETATGGALVFATDIEWPLATDDERARFFRLCREPGPVSLLCFDGAFTREEYPAFRSWGHSAWEDAVDVAGAVGARRLHVIHHSPDRDDKAMDEIREAIHRVLPNASPAVQGDEIVLDGEL